VAALSSFAAFTAGAALPLLPFLFDQANALTVSIALTAIGLFAVGLSMSLFTGRHALPSGLRMLGIGGAAGLATYFIGAWLGVALV
jgi:VIT1/CCC1 family predicted Fe2+/Mn2+ transporter